MDGKIISQFALVFILVVITLFLITVVNTAARIYVPTEQARQQLQPSPAAATAVTTESCGSPATPRCDARIIVQFKPFKVGDRAGLL